MFRYHLSTIKNYCQTNVQDDHLDDTFVRSDKSVAYVILTQKKPETMPTLKLRQTGSK